jgi:CMP-2-keto-3-deoxyoctulosonic acid synthetase
LFFSIRYAIVTNLRAVATIATLRVLRFLSRRKKAQGEIERTEALRQLDAARQRQVSAVADAIERVIDDDADLARATTACSASTCGCTARPTRSTA